MTEIGILTCGQNDPAWLADHGDFADWFISFLRCADTTLSFRTFRAHENDLPAMADTCDAWLVTGSVAGVYDHLPWQAPLGAFLMEAARRRPVIGICYGHQLLHHLYGGSVDKMPTWGLGVHRYAIDTLPDWAPDQDRQSLRLIASHQDQVTSPAPGSRVLGGNDHCPIGMTEIGRSIFTMQLHPEITPDLARKVFMHRRALQGYALTETSLASLAGDRDEDLARRWVIAFLQQAAEFLN